MRLSPEGLALIKHFEGFRSHVYLDPAGLPTIGYGHRLTPGEQFPEGISQATAAALLADDALTAEQAVSRLVTAPLNQNQFDALVDFVFNLGAGSLARSTLLKDLNSGETTAAADQFLRWDRSGGQVNLGLEARREAERLLFLSPADEIASANDASAPEGAGHEETEHAAAGHLTSAATR